MAESFKGTLALDERPSHKKILELLLDHSYMTDTVLTCIKHVLRETGRLSLLSGGKPN